MAISSHEARIAIYDDLLSQPRVVLIEPAPVADFIETLATRTYELSHSQSGTLPFTVIHEIAENFIHADFKDCTVSILEQGNTICFSDQGPGIEKKDKVLSPGVTSATEEMKSFIKGVGSGFPIVSEYLSTRNGYLSIDDNAIDGTVVTISVVGHAPHTAIIQNNIESIQQSQQPGQTPEKYAASNMSATNGLQADLQERELRVLYMLLKNNMLGPTDISGPLGVSAPTATRILQKLEHLGLVEVSKSKKRSLSEKGFALINKQEENHE
jgi:predicted transcriptional regulator